MSTEKLVKISSGKILDYKIEKEGYKTAFGSKVITDNTNINVDLIPENDTTFYFGQRLGGIATVVGTFSANDGKKYAFAVLDAKYMGRARWGVEGTDTGLPNYSSMPTQFNTESATYNTDYILSNHSASNYPAFNHARNAGSIELNGKVYESQLPNAYELQQIYVNRVDLYSKDPTASSYTAYDLSNWSFNGTTHAYSSNENDKNGAWALRSDGYWNYLYSNYKNNTQGVIPIFEIPLD